MYAYEIMVHKHEIDPDKSFVSVDIKFSNGHGNIEQVKTKFSCEENAYLYLEEHLCQYLRIKLVKYIQHAEILYHTGHMAFYKTIRRTEALWRCIELVQVIDAYNLVGLSTKIKRIEQDLKDILPSPKNTSYSTSCDNLKEISFYASFARKYLKQTA